MTASLWVAVLAHAKADGRMLTADGTLHRGAPIALSLHCRREAAERALIAAARTEWDGDGRQSYAFGDAAGWPDNRLLAHLREQGYLATVTEQQAELSIRDDRLSPLVRELACLTLGHLDADRTACAAPVDKLVGDLVREVRRLRVMTGDDGLNLPAAVTALGIALTEVVAVAETPDEQVADELLDHLAGDGWALVKVDQR